MRSNLSGDQSDEHGIWPSDPATARVIQRALAGRVCDEDRLGEVRHIAGVDVAYPRGGEGRAVAVVLRWPDLVIVETQIVRGPAPFPYVPGLLSFREAPLVLEAVRSLSITPDLLIVDGQGRAHPRRFGLACHLGVLLDLPAIGCAKSVLVGRYDSLADQAGSTSPLVDRGEVIGMMVRSRFGTKPLVISIGHRISLDTAVDWIGRLTRGRRLPEPTRIADAISKRDLPSQL